MAVAVGVRDDCGHPLGHPLIPMYFDLSLPKLASIFGLFAAFSLGVACYEFVIHVEASRTNEVLLTLERERANVTYFGLFKLPEEAQHALAAVGAAGFQTTAPQTVASGNAASIPVLLYHGEGDAASTMPTGVFVDQMRTLKAAGWQTITLPQFEAWMKGQITLPDKSFLLTFDDGRTDTFYSTDPVLQDLGYNAVMFVITGFSMPGNADKPTGGFYLSKAELTYMENSGRWDLESHGNEDHRRYAVPTATSTVSNEQLVDGQHFLSNKFWLPDQNRAETTSEFSSRVTTDLTTAKNMLETDFGKPITAFAYPFNDFGEDSYNFPESESILNSIVPSLYQFSFYQTWPGNGDSFNSPTSDYRIKRIEPLASWSGNDLLNVLDAARAKSLPYAASTFSSEWESNWGTVTNGDSLHLTSDPTSTGSSSFLNGSEGWQNYFLTVQALWKNGTISLLARHTEASAAYAVCAFSQDRIYLEEHTGEAQVTLASAPYVPPALPGTVSLSMSVSGTYATCSAYGQTVSASIHSVPLHGGIGVSVWDPENGTADANITNINVHSL